MNQENIFCDNCGHSIDLESKFCDSCGHTVEDTDKISPQVSQTKNKLTSLFMLLLLVGLIINGYLLIKKHDYLEKVLNAKKKDNIRLEKKLDDL